MLHGYSNEKKPDVFPVELMIIWLEQLLCLPVTEWFTIGMWIIYIWGFVSWKYLLKHNMIKFMGA